MSLLMKKAFLPLVLLTFIVIGCQKEFLPPNGETTGGGSSGTGTSCDTYFPTSLGSIWIYANSTGPDNTITVTGPDSVINGNTFHKINSSLSGEAFIRDDNGNIYQYADLGGIGKVMMNVLRVNAAIGAPWRDTSIINGTTEIFEYQILEKNVSIQVSNATFSNAIHSQYKVIWDYPPYFNNQVVQVTQAWFGKCVGPLQTKTVSTFMGANTDTLTTSIKSYQIK